MLSAVSVRVVDLLLDPHQEVGRRAKPPCRGFGVSAHTGKLRFARATRRTEVQEETSPGGTGFLHPFLSSP